MKRSKLILLAAVSVVFGGTSVAGAEDVFSLDGIVVTAERRVSSEWKTPAAIEVLDGKDIERTGATGANEALKYSLGIVIHGQGPRNISQGVHNNKAVIRGVEKGTLVLVDGVPINQGGRYELNNIPVSIIERIEVVRGGGAVLYGSEAAGGVINIITKGKRANMVKAGAGNYGIQNYAVSGQAGNFGFTYTYDHTGKIGNISAPTISAIGESRGGAPAGLFYNIVRGEENHFNWRYDFNDTLYFSHTYGKNTSHYRYIYNGMDYVRNKGKTYKDAFHSTEENLAQIRYSSGDLKAGIFYHRHDMESKNYTARILNKKQPQKFDAKNRDYSFSRYLDETIGADISNRWQFDKGSFLAGAEFTHDRESFTNIKEKISAGSKHGKKSGAVGRPVTEMTGNRYSRNMYSLYGQLAYDFTAKNHGTFNWRKTWADNSGHGGSYQKFTPEIIFSHDVSESVTVYAKAGKSFMMPTFKQLYGGGNVVGTPDLKPQSGKHYELGLKRNVGDNQSIRLALYRYKIKDSIDAKSIMREDGTWGFAYNNEDVKNTGLEIEWARHTEQFSCHMGLSYSRPQKQGSRQYYDKKKGEIVTEKGNWHDYYGKVQWNGGIVYKTGKLTSALEFAYLGKRIRDAAPYESFKSQFFTDLNFSYQANTACRFFLNIDNVFNRHDIISTSSSTFYNLGRNFMAGMEYKF